METPTETISKEVQLAWQEMSAKWQQETTWPTLKEAKEAYGAAIQDHENASFLIQDLEMVIVNLEGQLNNSKNLPECESKVQADIIRDQIAGKQAEILSCEDRIVLIEQRVQRQREFYEHLLAVHNRKLYSSPANPWPRRQSQCEGLPIEVEELEDEYEDDNKEMDTSEAAKQDE